MYVTRTGQRIADTCADSIGNAKENSGNSRESTRNGSETAGNTLQSLVNGAETMRKRNGQDRQDGREKRGRN